MDGGADLPAGDYRISPTGETSSAGVGIRDVTDEDRLEGGGLHQFTVERPDGTPVLDVLESRGKTDVGWLPFALPHYVYRFVRPDGDPRLVVESVPSFTYRHAVSDPRTGDGLGTIEKSRWFRGNLQLQDPTGAVRATVHDRDSIRDAVSPSSPLGTYAASGPGGEEIAEFERFRVERGGAVKFRQAMDVSCFRSSVPVESTLALGLVLLRMHSSSSSSHSGP